MADATNDPNREGLDNLPADQRKETENILDEIDREAKPDTPKEQPAPTPEPKKPAESEQKPSDGKPEVQEDKKPKEAPEPRRDTKVKLIPSYVHMMAKTQWEQREADLKRQLAEATKDRAPKEEGKTDDPAPVAKPEEEMQKEAKAFAEKHNLTEELALDLLKKAEGSNKLPENLLTEIEEGRKFREQQEIKAEEEKFSSDFDKTILPLIKAEYGDDVPQATIDDIKDRLKVKAYTPEYAKIPYKTIYRGEDDFRGLIPLKQRGAEDTRGGHVASIDGDGSGKIDLTKPMTDAEITKLSPEQFDTYSDNMARLEKGNQK